MTSADEVGRRLRAYATHHQHGEGWTYTRDLQGMKHVRYDRDWKGSGSLWGRIKWTTHMLRCLGDRSIFRPQGLRDWTVSILATIKVNMSTETNMPDGSLNDGIVLVVWEEDGEYIEGVGPTVGVKIADFLEAEPEHPHAIAIAEEMLRIRQLGVTRRQAEREPVEPTELDTDKNKFGDFISQEEFEGFWD